jgi:hypothetical protein
MLWIGMFHDLEKESINGQRDLSHAFRSAATTGKVLPQLGFAVRDASRLTAWADLTRTALTKATDSGEMIQDNVQLAAIIRGIDDIFGLNSPAALIVKAVLFHMSINVVADWPQAAPLMDQQVRQFLDAPLLPLLRAMMLADNDAWTFFDPEIKLRYRSDTRAVFERITRMTGEA